MKRKGNFQLTLPTIHHTTLRLPPVENWPAPSETRYSRSPANTKEATPRYHNRDPEYCLLSEERNPFRNNQQQILEFSMFGSLRDPWGPPCSGVCRGLLYATYYTYETRMTPSLKFLRITTTIAVTTNTTATITASTIARTTIVSNTGISKVDIL